MAKVKKLGGGRTYRAPADAAGQHHPPGIAGALAAAGQVGHNARQAYNDLPEHNLDASLLSDMIGMALHGVPGLSALGDAMQAGQVSSLGPTPPAPVHITDPSQLPPLPLDQVPPPAPTTPVLAIPQAAPAPASPAPDAAAPAPAAATAAPAPAGYGAGVLPPGLLPTEAPKYDGSHIGEGMQPIVQLQSLLSLFGLGNTNFAGSAIGPALAQGIGAQKQVADEAYNRSVNDYNSRMQLADKYMDNARLEAGQDTRDLAQFVAARDKMLKQMEAAADPNDPAGTAERQQRMLNELMPILKGLNPKYTGAEFLGADGKFVPRFNTLSDARINHLGAQTANLNVKSVTDAYRVIDNPDFWAQPDAQKQTAMKLLEKQLGLADGTLSSPGMIPKDGQSFEQHLKAQGVLQKWYGLKAEFGRLKVAQDAQDDRHKLALNLMKHREWQEKHGSKSPNDMTLAQLLNAWKGYDADYRTARDNATDIKKRLSRTPQQQEEAEAKAQKAKEMLDAVEALIPKGADGKPDLTGAIGGTGVSSSMPGTGSGIVDLKDNSSITATRNPNVIRWAPKIIQYANSYGVPANLVAAVMQQESGGNPKAGSPKGARGLMQLMPGKPGVTDYADPDQNINAGVRELSEGLRRYGGNIPLALAAYNAGAGAVQKYGGIPPYKETRNYVKSIMAMLGQSYDEAQYLGHSQGGGRRVATTASKVKSAVGGNGSGGGTTTTITSKEKATLLADLHDLIKQYKGK